MKLFLIYLILVITIFSQEEEIPYDMEILIQTQNFQNEDEIIFKIIPFLPTSYCIIPFSNQWVIENNPTVAEQTIIGNYIQLKLPLQIPLLHN